MSFRKRTEGGTVVSARHVSQLIDVTWHTCQPPGGGVRVSLDEVDELCALLKEARDWLDRGPPMFTSDQINAVMEKVIDIVQQHGQCGAHQTAALRMALADLRGES